MRRSTCRVFALAGAGAILGTALAGCESDPIPVAHRYMTPMELAGDLYQAGVCRAVARLAPSGSGEWSCPASTGELWISVADGSAVVSYKLAGGCEISGPDWLVFAPTEKVADEVRHAVGGATSCV